MKLVSFFTRYPVFTSKEFSDYVQSTGTKNIKTIWALLNYHEKVGNIRRIRRGFYATASKATIPSTMPNVNPYLIAGRISSDSVLAYHTALEMHGFAHSIFYQFYFFTKKFIRQFTFQDNFFRAMRIPKSVSIKETEDFAIVNYNREGLDIRLTSLERTLVDSLDRPEYAGGFEEIWQSFATVPLLNLDQVIRYVLFLDNSSTVAKVGFFLEEHREQFNVEERDLLQLEKHKPRQINYLERNKRISGHLIKRWNLIVPETIIKRKWEEPSEIF